ncbi:MAG TPA: tol-pal system protein YbgF [Acidobacteriaceae bacterium]|nr:tol-pal system protein YbgF [Acidobacteriaceae bacterium]
MNALQNDLDTKLANLSGQLTAIENDTRHTADLLAGMQSTVSNSVSKSLAPVGNLNNQVTTMTDDLRALKEALNDLGARLDRMDAKITDLKNQMQIIQNPPAAPGTPGAQPPQAQGSGSTTPPPGMSAEKTYTDAMRDLQQNNTDLAYQEFQQYITYFPNTELAANAQYYLGQIDYNRGNYTAAIDAFDAVLERYPENSKSADARLMKGMALSKSGQRSRAAQEFRALIDKYPRTDDAKKALHELHQMGLSASTASKRRRTK